MAGLHTTTRELARFGKRWRDLIKPGLASAGTRPRPIADSRLQPVTGFGSNPGGLGMFVYAPPDLPPSPAMVVVLHGCTQNAADYAVGAGWATLAERHGFVLLAPEQTAINNQKTCFNWFLPGDITRGEGEALSVRQMVERAATDHGVDRSRVFVTGLSAGGAMAAVMLATYPEVFAGGGIVAGLPYGSAGNVQQALQAMFQTGSRPARDWGDLVRAASPHRGPWPRLSVWHGGQDAVVKPANAEELVKQWTDVHGLPTDPSERGVVDGHPREVWRDGAGREVIESFAIGGMGHGTPLEVGPEDHMSGAAGPFLLDVGISSSYHMAAFWGLVPEGASRRARSRSTAAVAPSANGAAGGPRATSPDGARDRSRRPDRDDPWPRARMPKSNEVGAIITDALRAAGLLKR